MAMAGNEDGCSFEALLLLEEVLHDQNKDPVPLPLPLLQQITDNFSEDHEIGRGSFGVVYKGRLRKGKIVAVKNIDTSKTDATLLENEISCMMRAKHKNILRLLGYYRAPEPEKVLILCSEYAANGSVRRYLRDKFCRYQWSTRYQIILGISAGLDYLHTQPEAVVHRDLKPDNVLLDHNMVPKIADFGLSKRLDEDKSHDITFGGGGTWGYIAPEIVLLLEFSTRSDIYCLGLVILDILIGREEYLNFLWSEDERGQDKINKVLQFWTKAFETETEKSILQKQVKVCAALAMQCLQIMTPEDVKKYITNDNNMDIGSSSNFFLSPVEMAKRSKQRPSASEIVHWLGATENWTSMSQRFQLNLSITEREVLDIHPGVLSFPFGAHVQSSSCVLNLTNNSTEHCVGFWIQTQLDYTYDGTNILGPLTSKAVTVELHSLVNRDGYPPVDTGRVNVLMVAMSSRKDVKPSIFENFTEFTYKDIQSLADEMHEASLPVVVCPVQRSETLTQSFITAMDVHQTKPWILTNSNDGRVCVWNYQTKIAEKEYEHRKRSTVTSIRFIPRDGDHHRIVIGDSSGFIYVISWAKNHDDDKHNGEIMKTLSRPNKNNKKKGAAITSLAVHAEEPLLLWADDDGVISLQSWQGNNTYVRTFEGAFPWVTQVRFHPTDRNCFIEASGLIKVWKIDSISTQPTTTTLGQKTGLFDYYFFLERAFGLFDYPYTDGDMKPTIAILRAGSAEIWDLEAGHMVGEITFDHDDGAFATAIACHPIYPVILLGTKDRVMDTVTISLYNSNNYRLEKMIKYTDRVARIQEFGFLKSKWLVIRYDSGEIHVLEIDMVQ